MTASHAIEASSTGSPTLLKVSSLGISFPAAGSGRVSPVEDVSFTVAQGECVGIVGESGSGKSLTAKSITRLLPERARIQSGEIVFDGRRVSELPDWKLEQMRGRDIGMVFQDPMTSLNPLRRIGAQMDEAVLLHRWVEKAALHDEKLALLTELGIPDPATRMRNYPHEYSGGMRQRISIAMAIANKPRLLVADEPTTALDVTIQSQLIELLRTLAADNGTAILLITHNIAVVASLCTQIVVMYAGRVVERGASLEVLKRPRHPYTDLLLRSRPAVAGPRQERLVTIAGQPPDPSLRTGGCKFAPRCPRADERCRASEPPLEAVASGQSIRCWYPVEH
jgi:oligopeptide/dipeptide ABC transporter ATP-binding protein